MWMICEKGLVSKCCKTHNLDAVNPIHSETPPYLRCGAPGVVIRRLYMDVLAVK